MKRTLRQITHFNGFRNKIILFLVNKVFAGTNPRFFGVKSKLLRSYGCTIGEGTKIVGPILINGPVQIGEQCWIGRNLQVHGNGSFIIGDRCDIAPDVTILTGGHEIGHHDRRAGEGKILTVSIGNGCWVGARSTILGDVTIYDGCVIAACSCVIRDTESDTLVAGVPARKIRDLDFKPGNSQLAEEDAARRKDGTVERME